MKPYIFRAHNGVHIIDLTQTVDQLQAACNFLGNTIRGGGKILFVGTKNKPSPSYVSWPRPTNNTLSRTVGWAAC